MWRFRIITCRKNTNNSQINNQHLNVKQNKKKDQQLIMIFSLPSRYGDSDKYKYEKKGKEESRKREK